MERIFTLLLVIIFLSAGCAKPLPPIPGKQPSLQIRMWLPLGYDVEGIYPASLACPTGIALTPSGGFLTAENHTDYIKKVTPDGKVSTVNWHGGPPPEIMKISPQSKATTFFTGLSRPSDIALSPSGELYVADETRI
jgi:hypothetical protein